MLRGEIRLVDLDPARPAEANKRRPAVIVSNDRANATAARLGRGVVTVVTITSNVSRVYPFQVALPADPGCDLTGLDPGPGAKVENTFTGLGVKHLDHCKRIRAGNPPGR